MQTSSDARPTSAAFAAPRALLIGRGSLILALLLSVGCSHESRQASSPASQLEAYTPMADETPAAPEEPSAIAELGAVGPSSRRDPEQREGDKVTMPERRTATSDKPSSAPPAELRRLGYVEGVQGVLAGDEKAKDDGMGGLLGARSEVTGSAGLGMRGTGSGGGATYGVKSGYAAAPVVAPNTELYTDHGTNRMTAAAEDHLSTFSIDVDTASYTIARRKLTEGALPPAASVRVEEFINYFQYRYQGPTGEAPFAVNFEAAPNPWQPQHHIVRVGVQGKELAEGSRPRRLTFLVDVSGSMQSEDKIGLVKQSLHLLVDQLGAEDSIALVTYAGSTRVVLEATPVTRRETIHAAIEDLTAGGSTAMGSGLSLAYEQASEAYVKGAENRVLVLSDGDANVGPTSYQDILRTVEDYSKKGITLSTLGFGSGNYKDTTMEQIADKGDGNYTYVDSYAEARRVFGEKLTGTLDTIARDVKIQVDFDPDAVISWRLIGYENRDIADRDFRNDKVDAGEVGSGHSVTALYDVILADDALSRGEPLASVHIRAKKPGPDMPAREFETALTSRAFRADIDDSSQDFRVAVAAASFAEVLRGSRYAAELSYADVYALADGAKRRGLQEDRELCELIARAGQLSGQRGPWGGSVAGR